MKLHRVIRAAAILALGTATGFAGDCKVIANNSVKVSAISIQDLKDVFLRTRTSVEDGRVEPILLKAGAAHEAFLKDYIGKSDAALSTYYRSLVFTGKGSMPKSFASEADVAAYVAKTPGAIGYVTAGTASPGAKSLAVQ